MDLQCQITLLLVLTIAGAVTTMAFVLHGGQCVAPPPCTCTSDNVIHCDNTSLTHVPHFSTADINGWTFDVYIFLQDNQITSIPANAFRTLNSVGTPSIHFNFNHNMISSIDLNAFSGIESTIKSLFLTYNKLTNIPSVLQNLNELQTLHLEGNEIMSLDSSIILHLNPHLTEFGFDMTKFNVWPSPSGFDMTKFNVWPSDLSKLQHLRSLVIRRIPSRHLPLRAFAGFDSGLTSLTLSFSDLVRIPGAVCDLQNLRSLYFNHNGPPDSNASIFEPCSHQLVHLKYLSLKNNSLYTLPHVIHYFPSLTHLDLSNNKISFVHTNVVPYFNNLQELIIQNNRLTHIPPPINKLKQLETLYLNGNQLSTVEANDLAGLTYLETLYLNDNPIEHISPHAFDNNVDLYHVGLDGTKLLLVPEAVRYPPQLVSLTLNGDMVDCNSSMCYLKGWHVSAVSRFEGNCANQRTQTIKQYLLSLLPSCP